MILQRADILNFRSIKEQEFLFSPRCRVLVGINETGKSNLLKALALLSPEVKPTKEDIREQLPDEKPVEDAYVRFVFGLEESDIEDILETISSCVFGGNISAPFITYEGKQHTLRSLLQRRNVATYRIFIKTGGRVCSTWRIEGAQITEHWKTVVPGATGSFQIPGGPKANVASHMLVNLHDVPDFPANALKAVDVGTFQNQILYPAIEKRMKSTMPECIYWKYDENQILPGRIPVSSFIQNPDSCLPLKHMFELAGEADIGKAITDSKNGSTHGFRNLLHRVALVATKHIRSIWREYKKVQIVLVPNGDAAIDAGVRDEHNLYEMQKRSDGFKRFLSFLLMISVRVKTKQLANTLLLIDEPENSLHPSGARYLRDELLAISRSNYVVYSTHSPNMIDRNNIARHCIVQKHNETTNLIEAEESALLDEEVLLNALGTSAFEILKARNIVFEGWKDKRLFEVALQRLPPAYTHLGKTFSDVGKCHGKGVNNLRWIASLLELANRPCLIISDNDQPAKEMQREHVRLKGHGCWKRYSEIISGEAAITGEDFIRSQAIAEAFMAVREKYPHLPEVRKEQFEALGGKLAVVQSLVGHVPQEEAKKIIRDVKEYLFENLKPSQIDERYYELISQISKLL